MREFLPASLASNDFHTFFRGNPKLAALEGLWHNRSMRLFNIIFLLLISGCTVANQKGILLNVEQGTPMDETDIRQHCDLGDLSACALIRESLGSKISSKISIIQGLAPPDRAVFSALIPLGENIHWFLFDREERKLKKL